MIKMKRIRKEYRAHLRHLPVTAAVTSLREWARSDGYRMFKGQPMSDKTRAVMCLS